ncbi:MAG: DNA-binding protein [Clostridia bacterium]|nr:DNA-binding protein [Clostridia bacterium]
MFEKNLNIAYLLEFYGEVLPERKRTVMEYYYHDDLSLSEIAEEIGISRQGVRDIIKKSEEELFHYEQTLHLAERFLKAKQYADRALSLCREQNVSGEISESIEKLLECMQ